MLFAKLFVLTCLLAVGTSFNGFFSKPFSVAKTLKPVVSSIVAGSISLAFANDVTLFSRPPAAYAATDASVFEGSYSDPFHPVSMGTQLSGLIAYHSRPCSSNVIITISYSAFSCCTFFFAP
ncbi:hypothetical protein B484DRAFT_36153 [Ochromonadaceae sp. CCMP2298]|nr:hypothetical protein B484DRAFT_36153 [Ochromonadaceae sp. CCMP2298]